MQAFSFSGREKSPMLSIPAIDGVSIDICKGNKIGLIGRNGSGKTTLCRCLAGIYAPQSGTIESSGTTTPLFGALSLIEAELTGKENAHLLARLIYPFAASQATLVAEAIEFSELGEFLEIPVKFYSMGMCARLALSVITAMPSDLLILDEALNGADFAFSDKMDDRISRLISDSGAVILVTHAMEIVRKYCNLVWVYDRGRIIFDGDVEEGIARYLGMV